MADPEVGVTPEHLKGHEGADALAKVLEPPLMKHARTFGGGKSYISFPARNRQASDQSTRDLIAADLRGDQHGSAPKARMSGAGMSGLDSLAHAALLKDEMENGGNMYQRKDEDREESVGAGGGDHEGDAGSYSMYTMTLQRVCEMCRVSHDGGYGVMPLSTHQHLLSLLTL